MSTQTEATVLVVEDDMVMRRVLTDALKALPCEVVGEATDGEAAIDAFTSTQPDIVLLDLFLPKMDGLEVLNAIRAQTPHAYVVMLTNADDGGVIEDCMIAGARDYLKKSLPIKDMIERLEKHISRVSRATA